MPCFTWNTKKNKRPVTLQDKSKKYPLPLLSKQILTHDTRRFRFALPTPNHVLGISVGQHVSLSTTIDDEPVIRIYTPTSSVEQTGHVDIVVKIYFKDVNPDFPNGGKMSQYLENLNIGDTVDFKGPLGKHQYTGNGKFLVKHNRSDPPSKIETKKISMIAGGSGITPMYQLIQHICNDPKDGTEMRLLFANRTEGDILLRDELENLAKEHSNKLKIWYTIGKAEEGYILESNFRPHAGVCMYASDKISCQRLRYLEDPDLSVMWVHIDTALDQLVYAGIHRSHSGDRETTRLMEYLSDAADKVQQRFPSAQLVFFGDFNAHHGQWLYPYQDTDHAGREAFNDWKYSVGRINEHMIRQHLFPADGSSLVLLCGPPAMINVAATPALESIGFTAKQRIVF